MPKISAKGIILKYGTSATPTTELANIKSIGFKQGNRTQIDVTTHGSSVTFEHIDSGLRETAELSVTLVYDPADVGAEAIRGYCAAGTLAYLTVVMPDTGAAQWAMSGYVTSFDIPDRSATDALEATFTFKAKGSDTFTA